MENNPLHDKANYQGRRLALLLVALAVPVLFYYSRLAMAVAATRAGFSAALWLMRGSTAALVLFFVTQLAAAWYFRRLFRRPQSSLARALQIAGIAVICGAFSIGAAILLESFAYEMLIRTASY